jgi:esterase/lipase superfamily enzyme
LLGDPNDSSGKAQTRGFARVRRGAVRGGPEIPASKPAAEPARPFARIRVYYGTDRALVNASSTAPSERFGGDRGRMSYGFADVSIPRGHTSGELEAPSWLRFEFHEDPSKHVVLLSATPQPRVAFLDSVRSRVAASRGASAFVFVHGYNVSFTDAARRTAQMTYDLGFDGAPVFFSWPSQASLSGYTVDEANIEWATSHIERFLIDVADHSGAKNLVVVGHSMGSRGLTRALAALVRDRPDLRGRFRDVILAAPDIDADVFRNDIVPSLRQAGRHVTLYASSKDLALRASKEVHGYARAGDTEQGVVVIPGIDTIDASGVDDSILAHSYFVESVPVIRDIAALLRSRLAARNRNALVPFRVATGVYWRLAQDR